MMREFLAQAIAEVIEERLSSASDRIIRTMPSRDWPIEEALTALGARRDLAVLLQKPFDRLEGITLTTTDPGVATAWRNRVDRTFSVVVLGYPGSNLDAGLRDIKVVDNIDVLNRWRELASTALSGHDDLGRPNVQGLLDGIWSGLEKRRLSADDVAGYLQAIERDGTFSGVVTEMWRLALFVDSRVLDTQQARTRLERNQVLVDRLKQSEEALLQKLRKAHGDGSEVAASVLEFLEQGDPKLLRSIELSDVEDLLFRNEKPLVTSSQRTLDLFDLLNLTAENAEGVRATISDFQSRVSESPFEVLEGSLRAGEAEVVDVKVRIDFKDLSQDAPDIFRIDDDPIVTARHAGRDLPFSLSEANGRKLPLSAWVSRVSEYASTDEFVSLRRRLHFLQHVPSIEGTFVLLLLMPRIREDVLQYAQSWQSLVSEVQLSNAPDARTALLSIQSLEVLMDGDDAPEWLALSLLHPYRLEPIARVAEFCEAALLDSKASPEKLGDAAQWMLDRSVPAYPAFYREQGVFHLASVTPLLLYRQHSKTVLPVFGDSRGLQRALQAVVRYSPWLHRGASILLVDPPPGRGVSEALRSLRSSLASDGQLLVYHAQRSNSESDGLTEYDGNVTYLGSDWERTLERLPLVDVVLLFSPESETSHMSTAETWSAAPGTHMVLQLTISKSDDVFETEARPRIDVKPSSESGIVNTIQELYRSLSGGRAPHAAIEPLDSSADFQLLGDLQKKTDWTITARPGPFGLASNNVAASEFGYVGRAASGRYLVSVFAGKQVYGVRRYIEQALRGTPVATVEPSDMADRLVELARDSARSLIDAARQPVPSLGELVGLDLATATQSDSMFSVSLAMDDLGWTRAWLGQRMRPDFVIVLFNLDVGTVTIRIVECKSSESPDRMEIRPSEPVIREALDQVYAAATVMETILSPGGTLADDLQFSSFIEHLFAVLLNTPVMKSEARSAILDLANKLAERSIVPTVERWVFVSQPSINQAKAQARLEDTNVVWLGAPEIHRLLATGYVGDPDGDPSQSDAISPNVTVVPDGKTEPREQADVYAVPPIRVEVRREAPFVDVTPESVDPESEKLAREFILAMRLHNAEVGDSAPRFVRVGPSLISIGVELVEGSSLQPIRLRLGDIAREVGLGNREKELWIENSSEPGVIQVLMPRPDRVFPQLPEAALGPVQDDSYTPLFLGQTIDGKDFVTAVEKWPHMLVAGTTGSGKTTLLKSLLVQFTRLRETDVEVVIADGKGDTDYLGIVPDKYFPRDLIGVQLGADRAMDVAEWAIEELDRRSTEIHKIVSSFAGSGPVPKASDIYKHAVRAGEVPAIRPLILIIDEFADIMIANKKQVADQFMSNVQRLAQIGRSRLMHVVLATQRPDRNTIRGAVRANFDARIALRLPTAADSMTILGSGGAEKLMSHGDLLFRASSGQVIRLQGYAFPE